MLNNGKTSGKQAEMAGYDNIKGKGNRFSSTNQPKNRGRKPRLYTIAKKVYRISYEEWCDVAMYLMQCPKQEVERIASDPDTPIWVASICRALHKDAGRGSMDSLNSIIDRTFGKPRISADVEHHGGVALNITTDEETKRIIEKGL